MIYLPVMMVSGIIFLNRPSSEAILLLQNIVARIIPNISMAVSFLNGVLDNAVLGLSLVGWVIRSALGT